MSHYFDGKPVLKQAQMKETKTAKTTSDCPTLLHYIARVLLRTEPKLTLFIEELPNLEPAARSKLFPTV